MNAYNNGAFSNRIKCIMSCLRKSEKFDILWLVDPKKVDVHFHDLFENKEFLIVDKKSNEPHWDSSRLLIYSNEIVENFSSLNCDLTRKPYKDFPKDGRAIDHEYTRIPNDLQLIYRSLLNKLVIKEDVLNYVRKFMDENKLINKQFTALHVRTWNYASLNHTRREAMRKNTVDINYLIQKIEAILSSDTRFFIASDNSRIIEHFQKYDNVCVTSFYRKQSPDTLNGFIDMLIASHANSLYLTLHSTFSEMIWWYNKNHPSVDLI